MRWKEVRKAYPNQWLVIEALEAHTKAERRVLDKIAVVEVCVDGATAMQSYRILHKAHPEREYYFVHTRRVDLDIRERQWLGIRRGYAPVAPRIGIMPQDEDILRHIHGVGGSEVVFMRRVEQVRVEDYAYRDFEIEVGGMDYGFDIHGILGMDFLLAAGARIDLEQLTLEFR